jgi:hypothetical protein
MCVCVCVCVTCYIAPVCVYVCVLFVISAHPGLNTVELLLRRPEMEGRGGEREAGGGRERELKEEAGSPSDTVSFYLLHAIDIK